MDTKWKKRKSVISFIVFFLGVSLLLGNGIAFLQNWSGSIAPAQLASALKGEDYQLSRNFRDYISNRLELFLDMATDSLRLDGRYGYYYDVDYYNNLIDAYTESTIGTAEVAEDLLGPWDTWDYGDYGWGYDDVELWSEYYDRNGKKLTEEEKKEIARKTAEKYHEQIKGDQNLLYAISYDGRLLYTNSEGLSTENGMTVPEGYNFLLCFQEGKVRIWKDGEELDVYGDGYYRDDTTGRGSDWYVPGYRNFQVDAEMKKAEIRIAVAEEPLMYTERTYGTGGNRQQDNNLYWMRYYSRTNRENLIRCITGLAIGVVLSVLALLLRKSKREADKGIAHFQSKIWAEAKVILCCGLVYFVFCRYVNSYGYSLWQEMAYAYQYDDMISVWKSGYGEELLRNFPAELCATLFWIIYFLVNDLRYNRKIWKQSLAAKLYKTFSDRELRNPLSRRMIHRNTISFATAVLCGLLMLFGAAVAYNGSRASLWWAGILIILGMTGFLVTEYLIGVKNVEAARDVEALAVRIREIRGGNYESPINYGGREGRDDTANAGGTASNIDDYIGRTVADTVGTGGTIACVGHDLEEVMAQLEDIRHGMAKAVDEQMKSQRMKVELIANVSHDIKTPLTSIISYVQFLKEEENLPEHVRDYIMILDEKSQRLKNMVQDVFAVSKAASGELPVHMEELDFGKLLRQTLADMGEQIDSSSVSFRTEIPDTPVMIRADGQRMYRVFQNLFQNALQYSLEGSRVHVTLKADGNLAVASVKNTSLMEIEKGKDYTERFTRGDASRTDGGSGLGMSIAQSFTEACVGEFHWETNADLFVVTVSFRIVCQG